MNKKIERQKFIKKSLIVAICLLVANVSCEKMTDNWKQYVKGGEIIYPAKADSIEVHPGKYRIELQWLILSDPSVTSAKVFWDNRLHFVDVPIIRTGSIDTVRVMLNDMEERVYTFEIQTFDNKGNKSVVAEKIGQVYGDKYHSSLMNRTIQEIEITDEGDMKIIWGTAEAGTIAQEVVFTDTSGKTHTIKTNAEEEITVLKQYDLRKNIKYNTTFIPDNKAIDSFKLAFEEMSFDIQETEWDIDRAGFLLKDLPGDHNQHNGSNTINRIFTNTYATTGTPFISKVWAINDCDNLVPFPHWFTIDMGAAYDVAAFTLYQRGRGNGSELYINSNLRVYEIWGALEVDETYNPHDHGGVFDSNWIHLATQEIVRPADPDRWIAVAAEGHRSNLRVDGQLHRVRYLRIKSIDNWNDNIGSCPLVKKQTDINIAAIRVTSVLQTPILKR